jgi:hypothetical protein
MSGAAAQLERVSGESLPLPSGAREQIAMLTEKIGQIELRRAARGVEQVIDLAAHGDNVGRLVSCLGLSQGEASLVGLLHGGRLRGSRDGRSDSNLG